MRNAITKRKCQDEHSDARMWSRAGEGDEDSNPTVSVYRSIEAFASSVANNAGTNSSTEGSTRSSTIESSTTRTFTRMM